MTGHAVIHKNGITMDNRLDNLVLVNATDKLSRTASRQKETDYWEIIQQIRANPLQEFMVRNGLKTVLKYECIYNADSFSCYSA